MREGREMDIDLSVKIDDDEGEGEAEDKGEGDEQVQGEDQEKERETSHVEDKNGEDAEAASSVEENLKTEEVFSQNPLSEYQHFHLSLSLLSLDMCL